MEHPLYGLPSAIDSHDRKARGHVGRSAPTTRLAAGRSHTPARPPAQATMGTPAPGCNGTVFNIVFSTVFEQKP